MKVEKNSDVMPPISGSSTLSSKLDRLVQTGELFEQVDKETVRCYACGHYCLIKKGKRGICQIRFNHNGELKVPWGYVAALHNDPTEKKPFYHVFPGSSTMTFGMLGCDLHCPYCQNWDISQALRDSRAGYTPKEISPEQIVALAKQSHSRCIASSYNEPLITSEWAKAIFQLAKREGFTCLYVSNGNVTREVLEYLQQHVDGFNIDLKTMQDKNYRKLGAVLERILEGIRMTFQMGFWLEIVTLIVPGFNDSETEIREIARFIKSISPTIPWHVTAFHPDYKMTSPPPTPPRTIIRAAEIGYEEGLRYVYGGNLPGGVRQFENTYCPGCHKPVIERVGYRILRNVLHEGGFCPYCEMKIDGLLD